MDKIKKMNLKSNHILLGLIGFLIIVIAIGTITFNIQRTKWQKNLIQKDEFIEAMENTILDYQEYSEQSEAIIDSLTNNKEDLKEDLGTLIAKRDSIFNTASKLNDSIRNSILQDLKNESQ